MWEASFKKSYQEVYKAIAGIVIAFLLLSLLPIATFAEEGGEEPEQTIEQSTQGDEADGEEQNENEGDDGQDGEGEGTTVVQTGDAYAETDISNEVNTNVVDTEASTTEEVTGTTTPDVVTETGTTTATSTESHSASSTNDALVDNAATTTATTGENSASSTGDVIIDTGDAVAVSNIANVINTNIYNSNGFLLLLNLLFGNGTFDLRDLDFEAFSQGSADSDFFSGGSNGCSLSACDDTDVAYTVTNSNTATVTNSQIVRAATGGNSATGTDSAVYTGDAYAASNLVNVVNTNIVDSNYLLLSVNNIGNYLGDIVLPSAKFFERFFSSALFGGGNTQVDTTNEADISNDVSANADTGGNTASTTGTSTVSTGNATASANVSNHVNQNMVGGSSVNILLKVHGNWSGDIFGLPEGLAWEQTSAGVRIYSTNEGGSGGSGGNLSVTNTSTASIHNDVQVYALTGDNNVSGNGSGSVHTGNAYAAANVTNVANTNVVGQNWMLALFNILGDFQGNISFGLPDLWIGGRVESPHSPITANSPVTYTYTIVNNGDAPATDLILDQSFDTDLLSFDAPEELLNSSSTARWSVGDLDPGEATEVSFTGRVGSGIPFGLSPLVVNTVVAERETDANEEDNAEEIAVDLLRAVPGATTSRNSDGGGVDDNDRPDLSIEKLVAANGASTTKTVTITPSGATTTADYIVTVTNDGGQAYNAVLVDTIIDEQGEVVSEQEWNLGTILVEEEIVVTYSIEFAPETSGIFTNTAHLDAYSKPTNGSRVRALDSHAQVDIEEPLTITDVELLSTSLVGEGDGTALISWLTNMPAGSQVVYGPADETYSVDPESASYGYPASTVVDETELVEHSMALTNLVPDTEYRFRVISERAGMYAVGEEGTLSIPTPVLEEVLGDVSGTTTASTNTSADAQELAQVPNGQAAAALLGIPANLLDLFTGDCVCAGVLLLIVLAIFYVWNVYENFFTAREYVAERWRLMLRNTAFTAALIAAVLFGLYLNFLCYLWPILALALIVWVIADIREHRLQIFGYDENARRWFYLIALFVGALIMALRDFWCVTTPLLVLGIATLVWRFISRK